jgi:hypothetical protein
MSDEVYFLLTWEKPTQEPNMEPIEIEETQETDDDREGWVVFHFVQGEKRGMVAGAPRSNILTEKECDLVRQTHAEMFDALEEAKGINRSVKDTHRNLLRSFKDPEREI